MTGEPASRSILSTDDFMLLDYGAYILVLVSSGSQCDEWWQAKEPKRIAKPEEKAPNVPL